MIDWSRLVVGPCMGIFGEPVTYFPGLRSPIYTGGPPLPITAIFTDAYASAGALAEPGVNTDLPMIGVQLSQFPATFEPDRAQGDMFRLERTGQTFIVKSGQPDGRGGAKLLANLQA